MEYVEGKLLQGIVESGPPFEFHEKRSVVRQCCEALLYMERFGVVHRDFRGCNIFLQGRGPGCQVKVIDLGFMISADPSGAKNPNHAVRCAWQGDPARKLRFDWAPPEVRAAGSPNFVVPACSFDVFSFGVLLLKLLHGRTWTQDVLAQKTLLPQLRAVKTDVEAIGLQVDMLLKMLDHTRPELRPRPNQILMMLEQ